MNKNTSGKSYRFFYHYHKAKGLMTVHFRNTCYSVKHIRCEAVCETKWNATQPRIVMRGFASAVIIDPKTNTAIIHK